MAYTFTINSTDRTGYVAAGSLSIQSTLEHRDRASFTIIDSAGAFRPSVGQVVEIEDGADLLFAGTIDRLTEQRLFEGRDAYQIAVECVDWNQLCDRFYVAQNYEAVGQKLVDIVADAVNAIVPTYLDDDGVTTAGVEDGPAIEVYICNYKTVTEAFNELATITGYDWYIDYEKDLHFFSRETNTAPISLTSSSGNFRNLTVETTRDSYRNRQILRGGVELTSSRIESFTGDSTRKVFNVAFPVNIVSTITVNAVPKTFGIRGKDSGKDWYYDQSSTEISQDDGASALSAAQTLAVTYVGQFPMTVFIEDGTEVASRAAIEGGSGFYEALHVDQTIRDSDLGTAIAYGLIRKFRIPTIVNFETDEDGLRAGQLITITLSAHNLSGQYLISQVTASDIFGSSLRYQVTALSGEFQGTWVDFFRSLVVGGSRFGLRDNEVLVIGRTENDTVSLTDVLDADDNALTTFVYDTAVYGFAEYG